MFEISIETHNVLKYVILVKWWPLCGKNASSCRISKCLACLTYLNYLVSHIVVMAGSIYVPFYSASYNYEVRTCMVKA